MLLWLSLFSCFMNMDSLHEANKKLEEIVIEAPDLEWHELSLVLESFNKEKSEVER